MAATVEKEALGIPSTIWTGGNSPAFASNRPEKCQRVVGICNICLFWSRRCCQVHDQCYTDAMQHPECWPILDNPYTEIYDYNCDEGNKKVTCGSE